MQLKNPFSPATRALFSDNYVCWWCGQTGTKDGEYVNALHHIKGRVSNSPLNAAPIHNFGCHLDNGKLGTREVQTELLGKTLGFLLRRGYVLTSKDRAFVIKYKQEYSTLAYGKITKQL